MRKVMFRQTIHLHTNNHGKLRKISHFKMEPSQLSEDLILTPSVILNDIEHIKRHRQHYFMRRQQKRQKNTSLILQSGRSQVNQETGSFRAIHTASLAESDRGFPLRAISPIKPFRRGIRSVQNCPESKTIDIEQLNNNNITSRFIRLKNTTLTFNRDKLLQDTLTIQNPQYVSGDCEQFYKYRDPMNQKKREQQKMRMLAGTKIQPFKKYNIRQIHNRSRRLEQTVPNITDANYDIYQ